MNVNDVNKLRANQVFAFISIILIYFRLTPNRKKKYLVYSLSVIIMSSPVAGAISE